ncbi:hypothetical protein Tco_0189699 [Tanacetum coccineum]
MKFLRSLPTEWGMHVVVWRNKSDLGSISFNDLYNNFKIIEPEVKRSVISSSNSGSQNLAFLSGHSSYMADEEASTNFALIAFSDSEDLNFEQPEFEGYGVKVNKGASENISKEVKKTSDAPIIEDWGTGQKEVRPIWTNAMRVNHQKKFNSRRNFAPTAVLTKSGLVPFSTARENFSRTAAPVSAAMPFNTAVHKSFVNIAKPRTNAFQKSHSSLRRPFYQQTAFKNKNLNNKVNTIKANSVNIAKGKRMTSVVGKQGINVVKPTTY